EHGTAGIIINKLFHKAFQVAKRVRTETRISNSAVSISYAAAELAKKIFGELTGKTVMLIGAGEMGELAAKHLMSNGTREIFIANRTYERAVNMARAFKGTPVMFREIEHYLKRMDIVITSTAAPHFIITPKMMHEVMKERRNRPMFFIDIAVPRNIDPKVNKTDNVYLFDVDDLQGVVQANIKEREKEAKYAEEIVKDEIKTFYKWVKSLDVVPTIKSLREKFDSIRKKELTKTLSSLKELSDKDRNAVDAMTSAMINKILHYPVTHLKKDHNNVDNDLYIEAIQKLFDLKIHKEDIDTTETDTLKEAKSL
ncbi:MAG: glutamyl-tRNA reductase, partial [Thermodesulfobacteriota bacterium]